MSGRRHQHRSGKSRQEPPPPESLQHNQRNRYEKKQRSGRAEAVRRQRPGCGEDTNSTGHTGNDAARTGQFAADQNQSGQQGEPGPIGTADKSEERGANIHVTCPTRFASKSIMARPSEFHLGIATLLFAAAATALVIAEPFRFRDRPPRAFVIHASEGGGRVRVDWNPSDVNAFRADSAVLRVQDGGTVHEYPIDRKTLDNGGLDYLRKSGDVLLSLTLMGEGKPRTEALVRSIVADTPLPSTPGPQPDGETRARRR